MKSSPCRSKHADIFSMVCLIAASSPRQVKMILEHIYVLGDIGALTVFSMSGSRVGCRLTTRSELGLEMVRALFSKVF